MIEVILDTETTGLSINEKHRIVEIGCIELENQIPTNKIGLKATTSEKIGIIGKNQAIAVQSLVNLRDK